MHRGLCSLCTHDLSARLLADLFVTLPLLACLPLICAHHVRLACTTSAMNVYACGAETHLTCRCLEVVLGVQAAKACCGRSKPPSVLPAFQPRNMHAATERKPLETPIASREEGYFRTGVASSAVTDEQAKEGLGYRKKPLFAADSKKRKKSEDDCTKHKYSSGALAPGLMVCRFAVLRFLCIGTLCMQILQLQCNVATHPIVALAANVMITWLRCGPSLYLTCRC